MDRRRRQQQADTEAVREWPTVGVRVDGEVAGSRLSPCGHIRMRPTARGFVVETFTGGDLSPLDLALSPCTTAGWTVTSSHRLEARAAWFAGRAARRRARHNPPATAPRQWALHAMLLPA
jgi:hypothetical protein